MTNQELPDQELRDLLAFIEERYTPTLDIDALRADQDAASHPFNCGCSLCFSEGTNIWALPDHPSMTEVRNAAKGN